MNSKRIIGALCAFALMAGCASTVTPPEEYSGFLNDYSKLRETKIPSGVTVMRWIDPMLKAANYNNIFIEPTQFYPKPQATPQIPLRTLTGIASYYDTALKRELSKTSRLTTTPGAGTLIVRPAITAVSRTTEGFRPHEILPVALVAAAINTAAGGRDQNTSIATEVVVVDAATNRVVAQLVRKGAGRDLENSQTEMTVEDVKEALDGWASDIQQSFERAKAEAK